MTAPAALLARYERDGFAGPLDVVAAEEAADLLARLDRFADGVGGWEVASRLLKGKAHLPFPWLTAVVERPALLDVIEAICGPDVLCWGSTLWVKPPGGSGFVSYHQDARYLGLDPPITCSVWLALTDSTEASGCVRFVPGSHRAGVLEHENTPERDNMLAAGQHVLGVDTTTAVPVVLRAGQASLHHECTVHGSGPNTSGGRRVGLNIHYLPPTVAHTGRQGGSALVVRGANRAGIWHDDPRPRADPDPDVLAYVAQVYGGYERRARSGEAHPSDGAGSPR